ncbi:MAG: 4Fe-4S binding protein [Alloprevotella sp.]|nr:4Fe-4S binding protein [Alloprevotella sp.]
MLRKYRIALGAAFFLGITLLLLDVSGLLHRFLGWMPKVQLLPAILALNVVVVVLLVLLTLVFGRIYCSVICPLGVFQDAVAHFGRRHKRNRYTYSRPQVWLRYGVLAVFIALLLLGLTGIAALLAPYSTYARFVTHLFQPIWGLANNGAAAVADGVGSYAVSGTDIVFWGWLPLVVALVPFLLISVLAWRNGRTWCNTVCPVGTMLGVLSRFAWLKVRFDADKCRNCSLCTRNCKAACIDYKTHTVDYTRCVACGNCLGACKHGALTYSPPSAAKASPLPEDRTEGELSRRSFLISTAALATVALAQEAKKVDGGLAVIEDKVAPKRQTPITPPGSFSARNMQQHCTSCQLCISECPNKVLRPSTDLTRFMQPEMGYEHGYCRPECSRCSQVCPTGAICKILPPQKTAIQIGHAVWLKKNCLPLTDGVQCGNCARHCPTGSITMVSYDPQDDTSPKVPAVDAETCIGCGACENLCPARPFSAIFVEGHEVHRSI